ncbi:IS1380 family transposase [Kitasatospora sp. NBC_00240]|uniref:IS1380 family transposase n=1 Tax=Kitasatospora sp. NBC_00240 TaxID=2903567 RepID=UPI0022557985|nr:IS1380 family transposase [Kitasatospora sp. NBC_00240]MCX5215507.1 IS1380 family transposase [Kitasatospora sp. NBC_00240]
MKKISRRRTASRTSGRRWTRLNARVGPADESLTENGGLVLVAELDRALSVTAALDAGIGPFKERDRGLSGGEFALAMAVVQLTGEDHLVGFDRLRADRVGEGLLPAPVPPSTTAATLAARFGQAQREGIERASAQVSARALAALPVGERARILSGPVTIDLDAKDIEVFSTRKEQVIRSYKGEVAGRVHAAHWAQAQVVLVSDLLDGRSDGRSQSPAQIDRAVDAVRAAGARGPVLFQGDCGYYAGKVAEKITAREALFRLGVPRSRPLWRAVAPVHDDDWIDALDYPAAQVALLDYVPTGWPEGTRVIARRVRYDAAELSADPRSRRSRTVGRDQLALVLDGLEEQAYAYSFIATNEPLDLDQEVAAAEWEFRRRTKIEELFRDTAHGAGLNHLPSASHAVNAMWMWGALLAYNLSAWLPMLAPLGAARRRISTVRRLLIRRAARWTATARRHELHFTAEAGQLIARVLARIRAHRHPSAA